MRSKLRRTIRKFKKKASHFLGHESLEAVAHAIFFVPAFFFVAMGLAAIFAPKMLMALIAGFFLFLGIVLSFLTWKFLILRQKFERLLRTFEGKVLVSNLSLYDKFGEGEEESTSSGESKKIVYH